MHDSKSAISVQNLITEVAGLLEVLAAKDAEVGSSTAQKKNVWLSTWTAAFWETICREWPSIDQWRMNKVLLLVRLFLRQTFRVGFLAVLNDTSDDKSESTNLITTQTQLLESSPLSPRDRKVPDGLRLHVLDVWSEELSGQLKAMQKEQKQSDESSTKDVETTLTDSATIFMTGLEKIKKEALSKGVRTRAKEAIETYREAMAV